MRRVTEDQIRKLLGIARMMPIDQSRFRDHLETRLMRKLIASDPQIRDREVFRQALSAVDDDIVIELVDTERESVQSRILKGDYAIMDEKLMEVTDELDALGKFRIHLLRPWFAVRTCKEAVEKLAWRDFDPAPLQALLGLGAFQPHLQRLWPIVTVGWRMGRGNRVMLPILGATGNGERTVALCRPADALNGCCRIAAISKFP